MDYRGPMGPVPEPSLPLLKTERDTQAGEGEREAQALAGRRKSGCEDCSV